jgi:plastocyanin
MKQRQFFIQAYSAVVVSIVIFFLSFPAQAADTATVTIESFQFQPKEVTIKQGGTITFINKDAAPHTVSPAKDSNFTGTGRLLKNESKVVTFSKEGIYNYFCDFHPSMKGSVKVIK